MGWEAWLVMLVILGMITVLALEWTPPDLLTIGCLLILVVVGEVTGSKLLPSIRSALSEFGNPGLVTVGALFVVVTGLVQTGAMSSLTESLTRRPQSLWWTQVRLMVPVTLSSAFLNNTTIVAMFMPVVDDLCKKGRHSPSKLFMPMAFCATLGGVCTMIGTSTNLVVNGLLAATQRPDGTFYPALSLLEITWVGLPCAIVGVIYLLLASRWLLPDRRPAISLSDDPRQYTVEMIVQESGPLVGKTIEQAGLRHLPGLYLVEIERGNEVLAAVGPRERLAASDRLIFVGIVESVVDLRKLRGLEPATKQIYKLNAEETQRCLIEAVVAPRCPIVGMNIREGQFRSRYNAAVVAVARDGRRIPGKIGDIVLEPGDTLLLESHVEFVRLHRNSTDFYLVSHVENSAPVRHHRAWRALAVLGTLVFCSSVLELDLATVALVSALVMLALRCCTIGEARQSIDWPVLTVIGASLGLGKALELSGAASAMSQQMIVTAGSSPFVQMALIYILTMLLTELVTNNAAAVLMFPLAMATAGSLGVDHVPFVLAVMVAASLGFATPFGYQTSLMVYGPGGYRFRDYLTVGIPLDLIMMVVAITSLAVFWKWA